MNVGKRITFFRTAKNYSVNKLATLSGISQSYLRDIELGNKNPTIEILSYICEALRAKSGNYMVFFPSYQYMEQVEQAVEKLDFPADLLVQGQGMKEQERQEFLEEFLKYTA